MIVVLDPKIAGGSDEIPADPGTKKLSRIRSRSRSRSQAMNVAEGLSGRSCLRKGRRIQMRRPRASTLHPPSGNERPRCSPSAARRRGGDDGAISGLSGSRRRSRTCSLVLPLRRFAKFTHLLELEAADDRLPGLSEPASRSRDMEPIGTPRASATTLSSIPPQATYSGVGGPIICGRA